MLEDNYSVLGLLHFSPRNKQCCVTNYLTKLKFSTRTYQCLFRYALEPDAPSTAAIRRLIHLPSLHRVAVALANGRLFLCRDDFIPLMATQGEGTFVMTELGLGGAGGPLHCMAAIYSTSKGY